MTVKIEPSWLSHLQTEFDLPYFVELTEKVKKEYQNGVVYPPGKEIFRAFDLTPFDQVKVVIVGQDPYHGPGQANGLAFSVSPELKKLPPSLQNIYKELAADVGVKRENGDLSDWAKQGVLLLNATLTVKAHTAGSHQGIGWEQFTDAVIKAVNEQTSHKVFILWGKYAQEKGAHIDHKKHFVIQSPHPSPFSANNGFFGSKPFSQTNEYLKEHGVEEIKW